MTTTMFRIEFYSAEESEESDPDPVFTAEADNTQDLFTQLEASIGGELQFLYCDVLEGTNDLRYHVIDLSGDNKSIGVAIVVYP